MSPTDKVVLITGATKGIGEAIFKKLSSYDGITAVGISKSEEQDRIYKCDLASFDAIDDVIEKITGRFGAVDILVNNAGIATNTPFCDISKKEWNLIMDTNLNSCFYLSQKVLPDMVSKREGKIINIASIAGRLHSKTASVSYTTSKAALIGMTRQLAVEFAQYNIQINAICPSQTLTDMLLNNCTQEKLDELAANNPSKRLLNPEEVANLVEFLIQDKVNYINGSCLDMNGGIY